VPREERRTTITTSDLLTNPQYWRDRAKEIRVFAQRSTHPETKRMLQNIVADSEHLAQRAEERLQGSGQRNDCKKAGERNADVSWPVCWAPPFRGALLRALTARARPRADQYAGHSQPFGMSFAMRASTSTMSARE
jgi:hypothetical protein